MALSRSFRVGLGAAFLTFAAPSAQADILVPVAGATERKAEDTAMDAIACVAAVLSFHTEEAKAACGRLIVAEPREKLGYKFRGLALLLEHDFAKAEEDFRAALRLDPWDAEIQAGYAQSLSGQGHYAAAISHFDEALKLKKEDVRFLAARCWARMGEGRDLDLALADCNRAADMAPDFATARLNRGMVRLKQQNYRAAVQDFTRALDIDSDLPVGLFGRGFAYLQLKDEPRAEADIKAARRLNASIDALFIRTGILPASCREEAAPCPLPPALRVPAAGVWMASYRQPSSDNASGKDALDGSIRAMALSRLDRMLEAIALRLNSRPSAFLDGQAWIGTTAGAARHLARVQTEYRRLQQIACEAGMVRDIPCRRPNFQYTPLMQDNPRELELELDRTLDIVRVLWTGVCRSPSAPGKACRIE
jgi:Tfp pilus assembly protein PilF